MRALAAVLVLALAGCASPETAPLARPAAASSPATKAPAPAMPARPDFAASATVTAALSPDAQALLLEADDVEALLLVCERGPAPGEAVFHDYPVVKRVAVPRGEARLRLLSALYRGIAEGGPLSMCFEPHHGLRARRGDRELDLVLCFECGGMAAHARGVTAASSTLGRAALPELERLLGPIDDRRFGGRTIVEWRWRFSEELPAAAGDDASGARRPVTLAPGDEVGIVAVAESIGWGSFGAEPGANALSALGAQAAPAMPALARILRRRDDWFPCRITAQLAGALGPAAAPLAPDLEALLRYDFGPHLAAFQRALEAGPGRDGLLATTPDMMSPDDLAGLRLEAIHALGEIGPAAAGAAPLLERLAGAEGEVGEVGDEAKRALAKIRGG